VYDVEYVVCVDAWCHHINTINRSAKETDAASIRLFISSGKFDISLRVVNVIVMTLLAGEDGQKIEINCQISSDESIGKVLQRNSNLTSHYNGQSSNGYSYILLELFILLD